MKTYKGYGIPLGLLGLAIVGARTQNLYVLYGLILATCVVVALVAYEKVDVRFYPIILFAIGLSLLWQTTLMSNGLVGSDIHVEYYFYQLAEKNGWDASLPYNYNATIGAVVIAPFLSKLFHIDGIWIFKAVYPFLFAFITLLVYGIFKKQFGARVAFLSTFFFLSIPTWSLEMIGLPRQMLGELMLMMCAWLIINTKWRMWFRASLVFIAGVLGIMFHYVMGPIIVLYLGISGGILLCFKRRTFPVKIMMVICIMLVASGGMWYGWVSSGIPLSDIIIVGRAQVKTIMKTDKFTLKEKTDELAPAASTPSLDVKANEPTLPIEWTNVANKNLLQRQEPLIRTAFGLDFGEVSPLGKIFRILQFITQALLIIGSVYLFIKRRNFSAEYLSFAGAGVLLMTATILIPRFANMINATRFYHFILLFMAPALVLSGQIIFRNIRALVLFLMIPYFLFTSGLIFEVSQFNDISQIDVPYSIALSHKRVDVAGVFTENDIAVRDWAVEKGIEPLFLDINGMLLFSERLSPSTWHRINENAWEISNGWAYLPVAVDRLPDKAYVFLREWNTQHLLLTFKPQWYDLQDTTSGRRQSYPISSLGLGELLTRDKEVFRSGDAVLYEIIR